MPYQPTQGGLLAQIVQLTDHVAHLVQRFATVEHAQAVPPVPPHGVLPSYKHNIFDRKMFEPEKLEKFVNFRDWTNAFIDYVDMCDEDLGVCPPSSIT